MFHRHTNKFNRYVSYRMKPVPTVAKIQPWKVFTAVEVKDEKSKPDTITNTILFKYQADEGSLGG